MSNRVFHSPSFLYSPERIGALFVEVGSDFITLEQKDIRTVWFRAHETETDIFVWYDPKGHVIKQQVTHMGTLVEWNMVEGIRTGIILETEIAPAVEPHPAHPEPEITTSDIIHYDSKIQQQSLKQAIEIVKHANCMNQDMKARVIFNFNQELKSNEDLSLFKALKKLIRR